jgi:predicted nuclease of predicted toxin-antitoxin system
MASASDDVIRDYAARVGAVIVTKDEDFATARVGAELPAIVAALERGETLIEIV